MLSIQHEAEKFFPEIFVPNRVEKNRIMLVAKTRDDCMRRGLGNSAGLVGGSDLYRQRIIFGWAVEITCLDNPKLSSVGLRGNRGAFENAHLPQGAGLRAEPAASRNVFRQDFGFDARSFAIVEQGLQLGTRVQRR